MPPLCYAGQLLMWRNESGCPRHRDTGRAPRRNHRPGRLRTERGRAPPRAVVPRTDAGLPGAHRHTQPEVQRARRPAAARAAAAAGRRARRDAGARPEHGLDARLPDGYQGPVAGGRPAAEHGLAAAGRSGGAARFGDGRTHEGRRRHRHRQEQRARVRAGLAHLQPGVRHHAQRLGPSRAAPAAPAAARRCRWRCGCSRWPTAAT